MSHEVSVDWLYSVGAYQPSESSDVPPQGPITVPWDVETRGRMNSCESTDSVSVNFEETVSPVDWMYAVEAYSESARQLRIVNSFKRSGRCPVHGSPAEWIGGLADETHLHVDEAQGAMGQRTVEERLHDEEALSAALTKLNITACAHCQKLAERLALSLDLGTAQKDEGLERQNSMKVMVRALSGLHGV